MSRPILPLTAAAFAPFGDVIEAGPNVKSFVINQGLTQRFHDLAQVEVTQNQGRAGISIFRTQPLPMPICIRLLERHPLSSQAFFPLSPRPYLVVVAPPGDLDENAIRIFRAQPGQGVNYRAGTWHHFCLALEAESDFLVVDRIGKGENCDEFILREPFAIFPEGG
jgi:ureidoglycolate lyase